MQSLFENNTVSEDGQIEFVHCPLGYTYITSIFQRLGSDSSVERKFNRDQQRSLRKLCKSLSPFFSISFNIHISDELVSHFDSKTLRVLQRCQNRHPQTISGAFSKSERLEEHLLIQQTCIFSGIWKQPFTTIKSNFVFGSLQRYGRIVQLMESERMACKYLSSDQFVGIVLEFAQPANCVLAICLPKVRSCSFPKFTDQDYQQLYEAPNTYCHCALPKFDSYFTWTNSDLFYGNRVQQSTLFRISDLGLHELPDTNLSETGKVVSFRATRTFDYRVIHLETKITLISGIFDGYRS